MVNVVLLQNLAILLIAILVLIYSGLLVIKALVKLSYKLGIKEFILSFVLLAFSTSIPELFVGITSAINKNPTLSFGNVIGANIMDVTLVVGVAAIIGRRMSTGSALLKSTSFYMVGIAALPFILAIIGGGLSRIDGVVLVLVFLVYMSRLFKLREESDQQIKKTTEKKILDEKKAEEQIGKVKRFYRKIRDEVSFNIAMFVIGIFLVFFSADYVTNSALNVATELAIPSILVGMIIISIGTTLPELVLETRVVLAKRREMNFGDAMGSVVVNSTLILGIVALIAPFEISTPFFAVGGMFMLASAAIFAVILNTKDEITWKNGLFLLFFYFIFLITQLNIQSLS